MNKRASLFKSRVSMLCFFQQTRTELRILCKMIRRSADPNGVHVQHNCCTRQGCAFASNFKMRSDANAKISQKHFAKRCECEKISKSFCEAMRNFANFRKMRVFAKCEFSQNANFRKMRVFAKCVILKKVFMEIIFYYFFNLCTLMIKTHICAVSATGKKCS